MVAQQTRTRRVFLNTLTSYGRFAVSLAVTFYLTPLMIARLGAEAYGLWSLVFSVLGFFSLLDFGFGTATFKYVAECTGSGDNARLSRVLSTMAVVYLGLTAVAAAAVAVLSFFFGSAFAIPHGYAPLAVSLLWIIAARLVLLFMPLSLFRHVLFGRQQIHLINAIQAVTLLLYGAASCWALARGAGLLPLAWISLASMLVEHAAYAVFAYAGGGFRFSWRLVDRRLFREAASFSLFAFMANVAGIILLKADPVIIKLFLPLTAVSLYALALKIVENVFLLVKQFVNVLSPFVAHLKESGEEIKIRFILVNATRFALAPATIFVVALWLLGGRILELWVGPSFREATPVLQVLSLSTLLLVPQLTASVVLTMTGHHRFTGTAAIYSMVVNLVASIALVAAVGLVGCALGTLIATALIDVGWVIPYACRQHGIPLGTYVRRVVPAFVVPGAVQVAATLGLLRLFTAHSLPAVGLQALPGALLYLAVYWGFFVEDSEKALLRQKLLRKA